MTLGPGEYKIEDGCKAIVLQGVLHVTKKIDRRIKPGDFRCRDCKHRVPGRCRQGTNYDVLVCELRPKGNGLHYRVQDNDFPCKDFEKL